MKVRILRLADAPEVETGRLTRYLTRLGIEAEYETVSMPEKAQPVKGLNPSWPDAYGWDVTRYLKKSGDCDWLIVLWDGSPYRQWIATTGWTGSCILSSMPISYADDFYRLASHEIIHGLCAMLIFRHGIPVADTMDYRLTDYAYSHEMEPDRQDGNRARHIRLLLPYKHLLDPATQRKARLQATIDALKAQLAKLLRR